MLKLYFQRRFSMCINLGHHLLLKTFFLSSIFEPLNQILPNFWRTDAHWIHKIKLLSLRLIFGQKPCFLWNSTTELTLLLMHQKSLICEKCYYKKWFQNYWNLFNYDTLLFQVKGNVWLIILNSFWQKIE